MNIDWVKIPGGPFLMGSTDADDMADDNEKPQITMDVPEFYMARYPVTNAQFAPFVDGDGYSNPAYWTEAGWERKGQENWTEPRFWNNKHWNAADHPVVGVSWYEAVAFCRWLSAKLGAEVRLPTEAEWEKAARGTVGRIYPWGNAFDASRANVNETGIGQTSAVGKFPDGASPYGLLDMSGNVFEWTATKHPYWDYAEGPDSMDNDLEGDARRVMRGGCFLNLVRARAASRFNDYPDFRLVVIGFRVCKKESI